LLDLQIKEEAFSFAAESTKYASITCDYLSYNMKYPIIFRAVFSFGNAVFAAVPKWFMLIEL